VSQDLKSPSESGDATGALRVGVDNSPSPPLCFGPPGTLEWRGFEVDLLGTIAAKLGLVLRCESADWEAALVKLQAGRLDMLCRAVTITPERRRLAEFSDPYLETELSLVIRRGSSIQSPGDLIGLAVGVRRATTAEEFVRTHCPAAIIRTFDAHEEAHRALSERTVDAVVDHAPIAGYFAGTQPELLVSRLLEGTDLQCGMVLASGNEDLRRDVNRALAQSRADGTWEHSYRRWITEGNSG
jgi:polar amino acid transport system substrate-binding protein